MSWKRIQVPLLHWMFTDDITDWKRNVYIAIVAADGKPCLVVYFRKFDEDDGEVNQKMTIFVPKSCDA